MSCNHITVTIHHSWILCLFPVVKLVNWSWDWIEGNDFFSWSSGIMDWRLFLVYIINTVPFMWWGVSLMWVFSFPLINCFRFCYSFLLINCFRFWYSFPLINCFRFCYSFPLINCFRFCYSFPLINCFRFCYSFPLLQVLALSYCLFWRKLIGKHLLLFLLHVVL